jgi:hypothetical protein
MRIWSSSVLMPCARDAACACALAGTLFCTLGGSARAGARTVAAEKPACQHRAPRALQRCCSYRPGGTAGPCAGVSGLGLRPAAAPLQKVGPAPVAQKQVGV